MATGGGSKELKAAFKKAKEAIKSKDYQQALDHSKEVLRHDPSHYHGLVFVGKSASELGQAREAEQAYLRAADIDPAQILAWQGLCALYEKHDTPAYREGLVDVYQQLGKLLGDETKQRQTTEKLAGLYRKMGRNVEAADILHSLIQESDGGTGSADSWVQIIQLLSKVQSLDQQHADLLKTAYITVLDCSSVDGTEKEKLHQDYINFLLKMDTVSVDEVKASCSRMHAAFPANPYPLEKLTEIALIQTYDEVKASCSRMHAAFPANPYPLEKLAEIALIQTYARRESSEWSVYSDLAGLDAENGWALIGQAQLKLANRDIRAAKELITKATKKQPGVPFVWLFLAQCQLDLHENKAVTKSTKQGISSLKTYKHLALESSKGLKEEFLVLQGRAWTNSGLKEDALRAIDLFKKLLPESLNKVLLHQLLVQAYLITGDVTSAKQSFDSIPSASYDEDDITALSGWLLFHQGKFDEALERLKSAIANHEKALYHYWLGRVYWAMGGQVVQDKTKCLSSLLKAAKLDPNYSDPFLYIGHHYMEIGKDTVKAKRCYRKAYDLNPANEKAAIALGDACDLLDEKEEAIAVYTAVTNQAAAGGAKWAWLRLGLVQLRAGSATEAVESFQAVLRADPSDKHCQECLAEAYLSRGSYNAALKAFSRVVEMEPNSTYSLFKIGYIKQTVGLYSEAVSDYQAILKQSPDYVPALSGQGETYLLLARSALHEFYNVRAVSHVQNAIGVLSRSALHEFYNARAVSHVQNAIGVLSRAILLRPDFCGLWKLLGDACTLLAPLHGDLVKISVDGALLSRRQNEAEDINKAELLALGGRCYSRAIQRQRESPSLWHDLGVNYYHQYQGSKDEKTAKKALQYIKKAITLDKTNHVHWTALGIVAASKAIDDPNLAQHAFIKSIQLEAKNVIAWTNLGTLYLSHGNLKLANEAFQVSQSLEPNYVQCWIGQGMIAESLGSEEALDLYRHTTELSTHVEGGVGYADLVCSALLDPNLNMDSELYRYNITQMAAIPAATAAVGKVADRTQSSAEAHTLLGILLERQGLHKAAEIAYNHALQQAQERGNQQQINIALSNHGRALIAIGCAERARDEVRSITPLVELRDILQLGLALYRNQEWQEAYLAFEQALQLATSESDKSQILAALAMVAYQMEDVDNAKTLLFQCSQLSQPCGQGLLALCALGLQIQDLVLTNAALEELAKQPEDQELVQKTLVLGAAAMYMQGDIPGACGHLSKALVKYPSNTQLWSLAAEMILLLDQSNTEVSSSYAKKAKRLIPTHKNVMQVSAGAELCSGNHGNPSHSRRSPSLIAAQKAVHAMPGDVNNWALLGSSCSSQLSWQRLHQQETDLGDVNLKIAKFLLQMSKADSKLAAWVSLHTVFCMLQSHQWQEAKDLSKQLLEWCDYGSEANANLLLLHTLCDWMKSRKTSGLGPIREAVTQSQSSLAWQTLGKIYSESKMAAASEACYKQCLQLGQSRRRVTPLQQLAHLAVTGLKTGADDDEEWSTLGQQTVAELRQQAPKQPASHLLKALLHQHLTKQDRKVKQELLQGVSSIEQPGTEDYTESLLNYHLVGVLMKKDKEGAKAIVEETLKRDAPLSSRMEKLVAVDA